MNFEHPILKEQIITYLGNKRKLIGFIDETIDKLIKEDKKLSKKELKDITFFDIFSGSGVVSRYGKLKGLDTSSNDLEGYSAIIQRTIIGTNKNEVHNIFENSVSNLKLENTDYYVKGDNYQTILNYLNSLTQVQNPNNSYWSIHYAPKDTKNPDFHNERLFYTQENARKMDAIVEVIEDNSLFSLKEKEIIQTSLMYNMTWHINTSGTMKGFHDGWGGKGGNALERILGEIVLKPLPFIDGVKGKVFNDYAEKVFANNGLKKFDFIYADPPYNQHQYSANYNHLNTLANNDRYNPGPVVKGSRAGIRTDHNRSDFCKSTKVDKENDIKFAEKAFVDFINGVDARYIVMSYNNEGVISIDSLMDIMHQNGQNKVTVNYKVHDKFKGGKATQTSNKVMEYLIIIEKGVAQSQIDYDKVKDELLFNTEKHLFLDKYIDHSQICNSMCEKEEKGENIVIIKDNQEALSINKKTYKVVAEHLSLFTKEEIKTINTFELDNLNLMEKYIEDKSVDLAQKLLSVFKIKKYKAKQEEFAKRIEELK